jgi:hypothetical protein
MRRAGFPPNWILSSRLCRRLRVCCYRCALNSHRFYRLYRPWHPPCRRCCFDLVISRFFVDSLWAPVISPPSLDSRRFCGKRVPQASDGLFLVWGCRDLCWLVDCAIAYFRLHLSFSLFFSLEFVHLCWIRTYSAACVHPLLIKSAIDFFFHCPTQIACLRLCCVPLLQAK